jgi:cobalt/nickel transport system permease protein
MIQEIFARGDSLVHRSGPALRIVLATGYSFVLAVMHDLVALALGLLFSSLLAAAARLPIKPLAARLAAAAGFLALVWIVLPLTYGGPPLASAGPLSVSKAGVLLCLQITFKSMAILMAFTALVATMPTATLGHTLHQLRVPDKLIQLLLLAYRYIFVIEQEYQRLHRAAKMRNFRPASNLHTYRTYAYLVGMLFVRASERARRVHLAMKCRGFTGTFHSLSHYAPTRWNALLASAIGGMSLMLIVMEISG